MARTWPLTETQMKRHPRMAKKFTPCLVEDCNRNSHYTARGSCGYCCRHYLRYSRHGDPLGGSDFREHAFIKCSVPTCTERARSHGMCGTHFMRMERNGDLILRQAAKGLPKEWLQRHVTHKGDECLLWPFSLDSDGYGHINARPHHTNAHSWMCEAAYGPKPSWADEAAHNCGNRRCVNPRHLRWSTYSDNDMDKHAHGTMYCGEINHLSKLTEADIREIRKLKGIFSESEIGMMYGVHRATINHIFRRTTWAWLK